MITELGVGRVSKDVKQAIAELPPNEVRYVVDLYYQLQDFRIQAANQRRIACKEDEPHLLTEWLAENFDKFERQIKSCLDSFATAHRPGRWAMSIHGIGPVIAAGLLAHIQIERAPTVGHIWRFAGLDPTMTWNKGEKRPFNAKLKVLCWKIGQSFMKLRASENDIYGKVYEARKALEVERNESGMFAEQAAATLETKKIRDKTTRASYDAGKLPDGRIELRAERYAVKLFLSHLHHVMYEDHYGTSPPKPYILTQPDHAHFLAPPKWPCE